MDDRQKQYRGAWEDGYARRQSLSAGRERGQETPVTAVLIFSVIGSIVASVGSAFAAGGLVATLGFHPLMAVGAAFAAGGITVMTLLPMLLRQQSGRATTVDLNRPSLVAPTVKAGTLPASRAELVQGVLSAATANLLRLEQALPRLRDFTHVASVAKMVAVGQRVAVAVAEEPEKLSAAQRLFTFYCPKAVEVVDTLLEMQSDPRPDATRLDATRDVLTKLELVFDRTELELKDMDGQVLDIDLRVLNQALDEDLKR